MRSMRRVPSRSMGSAAYMASSLAEASGASGSGALGGGGEGLDAGDDNGGGEAGGDRGGDVEGGGAGGDFADGAVGELNGDGLGFDADEVAHRYKHRWLGWGRRCGWGMGRRDCWRCGNWEGMAPFGGWRSYLMVPIEGSGGER